MTSSRKGSVDVMKRGRRRRRRRRRRMRRV